MTKKNPPGATEGNQKNPDSNFMSTSTQDTKTIQGIQYPDFIENPAFDYRAALIRHWLDESDNGDQHLFKHFLSQYLNNKPIFTASMDYLVTPQVWERMEGMHKEPFKTRIDVLRSIYLCSMQMPEVEHAVVPRTGFAVADALDHWGDGNNAFKNFFAHGLVLGLVALADLVEEPFDLEGLG